MKAGKLLLTGLLSFGIVSVAIAEENEKNPGGFGFKGGVGISTLSFGDPLDTEDFEFRNSDNSWKIGGMLGITYEKRFGKTFAMDFEALLANKGVKREFDFNNGGNYTMKGNLFTVDVPISAKIYLGNNFNFYVGPYFSYVLGGNLKADASMDGTTVSKESGNWYGSDYKDNNGELPMNRFDVGANAGIEFVSNKGFGVGARFQKGFLDLTNDDYKGSFTDNDGLILPGDDKRVTNTGFQVYGIFRF